ncbi:hypothetical protein BCEP4_1140055 [Burkholderia cepacia]|nr:hypothetical protein BCEP4_1140055 [Burkholderia cepacia]
MHTSRRNWNAFIPMNEISFLSLCVAAGLAVVWSIIFIGKITTQKQIAWGDVKTWIRKVIDSLKLRMGNDNRMRHGPDTV